MPTNMESFLHNRNNLDFEPYPYDDIPSFRTLAIAFCFKHNIPIEQCYDDLKRIADLEQEKTKRYYEELFNFNGDIEDSLINI